MKSLSLIVVGLFILLWGCNKNPKKLPAKYTDFERGWALHYYKKYDSALFMLNRYVENPDDSLKKGVAYRYMGDIYLKFGDLHAAQENGANAVYTLTKYDTGHFTQTGFAYNLLGDASLNLKRYDEAITMYNEAIDIFTGDVFVLELMNGKATALQKKGAYTSAIAVYDSILALKPADQSLVARAIDNRARTRWLQDPAYPVLPEFWQALKIRTDLANHAGLNASYAHLSDYYAPVNKDSALWYANKMHATATANQSPDDILEAIDKLIMFTESGAAKEQWYEAHKRLGDSIQYSRDTTRNRFALIRFDVQKSKADNLLLQQHITRQRLLIYGVSGMAVLIILAIYSLYNKRRKRIRQESADAIRDARLKTSQKVHDVVANGLYSIMNELEHSKTIEREPLINKIEVLYEKSRDISYENITADTAVADYKKLVHDLLHSFAQEKLNLFIVGNEPTFWNRISSDQKQQLQLVLHEIMVNMKKHSQAKKVAIGFKTEQANAYITYRDDGTGFPLNHEFGNGLKNTVSRIKSIKGEINFGKSDSGGASITISFPLHPTIS